MFVVTNAQSNYTSPKAVGTSTTQLPNASSSAPGLPADTAFMPPYTLAPTGQPVLVKANARTALFPELWRAYWNVMAVPGGETPYGPDVVDNPIAGDPQLPYVGPPHRDDLYRGSKFPNPAPTGYTYDGTGVPTPAPVAQDPAAYQPTAYGDHFQRMFRSPIRDNPPPGAGSAALATRLKSDGVMSLRSALAAINTTAMRQPEARSALLASSSNIAAAFPNNADNVFQSLTQRIYLGGQYRDPTSNRIPEPDDWSVQIFGAMVQPYITEVYVSTDNSLRGATDAGSAEANPVGYAVIELFNPYNVPIVLDAGWQIQVAERASAAPKVLVPIHTFSGEVIPAGGYLLIESWSGTAGAGDPNYSRYRPPSSGLPTLNALTGVTVVSDVPLLAINLRGVPPGGILNREVVITRTLTNGANSALMPIDSFDFTGLTVSADEPAVFDPAYSVSVWHYSRQNFDGAQRGQWGFVYPGRYDGGLTSRRQQGTQAATWNPSSNPASTDPFHPTTGTSPTPRPTLAPNLTLSTHTRRRLPGI